MFRNITIIFVVGLVSSVILLAGCKKEQPKEPAPSAQTQPSAENGKAGQADQQARLNLQAGLNYFKERNFDKAIKEFTVVIEKNPNYYLAYSDRAGVFMEQKKFDEAAADLKKALEINPDSWEANYNLAALYSIQNQTDSSLRSLDRALELGFKDYDLLKDDPDLNNVRKHPEFRKILKKYNVSVLK